MVCKLTSELVLSCDLCGLSVGHSQFKASYEGVARQFCCLGCRNVYAILHESGLIGAGQEIRETELFRKSLALGLISNGDRDRPAHPAEAGTATLPTAELMLQVSGMWCSSCAWLIEHALLGQPGIVNAEASFAADLVRVTYCPQLLPGDRIATRIESLGYQTSDYPGESGATSEEKRDLLLRLGVAAFFWMNIMTLSTALYVGYFEQIAVSVRRFMPFVLMALALPVVCYSAWPILRLAWRGAVNLTVRMETLLALGILAAFFYSTIQAFTGGDHVYFDTASAIVTLVLLGKVIERNAKERTIRAITSLYRMMPRKVRLLIEGQERFVTIEALGKGQTFLVKAGERIPADGLIIAGNCHADESLLTGEATPVPKTVGSEVISGSINLGGQGGVIEVRATRVGEDSTLARIIQLVENALSSKSPLERTVDRISRFFVPGVVVIAVASFLAAALLGWTSTGEALLRAITILVIACPCALGMATPLAVTAAIGTASQSGILVSDSLVLETIRRINTVIFDKTGTITRGRFALIDQVGPTSPQNFERRELPFLAALERYSEHPLGQAVVAYARQLGIEAGPATQIVIDPGLGISGLVEGSPVEAGNRRFFESRQITLPTALLEQATAWERMGRTVSFYALTNGPKSFGALAFGDTINPEAAELMTALKSRGVATMIVSGDAVESTAWVAKQVGADEFVAAALPQDKIRIIEELQQQGQVVAMVGDGINDAPALARADLGMAIGSGAEMAMKAAAVVLMTTSLRRVVDVFDLAARTWRIVRQNLFWAFLYNTLAIGLAITGVLNPLFAAVAMLLSSVSVIANSMRLNRRMR